MCTSRLILLILKLLEWYQTMHSLQLLAFFTLKTLFVSSTYSAICKQQLELDMEQQNGSK